MSKQLTLSVSDANQLVDRYCQSSLVPDAYKGKHKQADAFVAIMLGDEVGLKPLQSLQSIAVINGKPTFYGDGLIALVQSHPKYEYMKEQFEENDKEGIVAICEIKRQGAPAHIVRFSEADAKTAGLWGRKGPWTQYLKRMLQMRSRGFACRDQFADVLKGMIIHEEAQDYAYINVTPNNKSKASVVDIKPEKNIIVAEPTTTKELVAEYKSQLDMCGSLETLTVVWEDIKKLGKEVSAQIKDNYAIKYKQLRDK